MLDSPCVYWGRLLMHLQAFSIGLTATIGAQIQNGMGKHIFELSPEEMVDSQKV